MRREHSLLNPFIAIVWHFFILLELGEKSVCVWNFLFAVTVQETPFFKTFLMTEAGNRYSIKFDFASEFFQGSCHDRFIFNRVEGACRISQFATHLESFNATA